MIAETPGHVQHGQTRCEIMYGTAERVLEHPPGLTGPSLLRTKGARLMLHITRLPSPSVALLGGGAL